MLLLRSSLVTYHDSPAPVASPKHNPKPIVKILKAAGFGPVPIDVFGASVGDTAYTRRGTNPEDLS